MCLQGVLRQVPPVQELVLKPDCQGIHREHARGRPRVGAQSRRNRLRGAPEAAQRHFVGEETFLLID